MGRTPPRSVITLVALLLWTSAGVPAQSPVLTLPRQPGARPLNIIFVLADDHRYDALGFLKGQAFVETPNLDTLARQGAHLENAVVTTALCSPSRASILTGQYTHQHRVIDNNNPVPPDLVFFPQYLQAAGYATGFVGKWHMGRDDDAPQRGFDHWVSFRGQGTNLPNADGLNVNGRRVPQRGYITDELTDYALDWLGQQRGDRPFMLYLSHNGVHSDFVPAARHRGRFRNAAFVPPRTQDPANVHDAPMWVRNQRNSWHGVDFPYHTRLDIADYYRRYAETLLAVDESVGRVAGWLRDRGLLDSTLIVYMGDNGFAFGEHGLIDKRTAYEESMRVPMLMQAPGLIRAGAVVEQVVANIDIAPTLLEAAGLQAPAHMAGRSLWPLLRGQATAWRDGLLYEYYWERNFPQTPTLHTLRGSRYKHVRYQGIWDIDELYDLQADPLETTNLIFSEAHEPVVSGMGQQLFELLSATGGLTMSLRPDRGTTFRLRRRDGPPPASFPPQLVRDPPVRSPP